MKVTKFTKKNQKQTLHFRISHTVPTRNTWSPALPRIHTLVSISICLAALAQLTDVNTQTHR